MCFVSCKLKHQTYDLKVQRLDWCSLCGLLFVFAFIACVVDMSTSHLVEAGSG